MAYRKSGSNQHFTVIYQEVAQHDTMSMEARGLLLFMLSLPEDWEYNKKWLQNQCPGWGREKLAKILKELEQKGYLIRTSKQDESTGIMLGWDWEILAESTLNSDLRETPHTDEPVQENRTETDLRVSRLSALPSDRKAERQTYNKEKQKIQSSKSVNSSPTENFYDQVMIELLSDNLPESKIRYAQLKIRQFEERFPDSGSVADCWSYVVQAVKHQINITSS